MLHARHHSATRAVLPMLLGALSLAGCGSWHDLTDNVVGPICARRTCHSWE